MATKGTEGNRREHECENPLLGGLDGELAGPRARDEREVTAGAVVVQGHLAEPRHFVLNRGAGRVRLVVAIVVVSARRSDALRRRLRSDPRGGRQQRALRAVYVRRNQPRTRQHGVRTTGAPRRALRERPLESARRGGEGLHRDGRAHA